MTEQPSYRTRLDPVGRVLFDVCRLFAICGGLLLTAIGLLTVVSVTGRYLFSAPVEGDFELVELGTALSVFAFLPWCQMVRGNVMVDFFTANMSEGKRGVLDAAGALAFAGVAALLGVQLAHGGMDMYDTQEQTVILELYRFYSFYPIVACVGLLCLVALYTAWQSLRGDAPPEIGAGS